MAVIETTNTHAATGRIGRGLSQLVARITAWMDTCATRKALSALSDRELDDIGLTRSDVENIGIYH